MPTFDLKQRYNRNEFDNFIRAFLPDDYTRKETKVTPIGFQPQYATDITLIGVCKSLNLDVYEIRHSSVADARVGIANDTFKLLQHNSLNNNALVAFIPKEGNEQWRFSLLQIELDAVEQSSRIKRSYSNPRRYSYVLGPDAHVRTPEKFLIDTGKIRERRDGNKTLSPFEDLQSRFSVEVLSKEFYDNLFNWYLWATQHPSVSFPDKEDADAGKDKSVKVIRLITRMLFVWFIKQKGLVPSSLFNVNEMKNVLKKLDPESNTSSTYYNAILQNLFFATLNRPVIEVDDDGVEEVREFAKNLHNEDAKNLYRYEELFSISKEEIVKLFNPIPFLNASLFDCLDKSKTMNGVEQCFKYDGFSRNSRKQAHVPNELFFGKEQFVPLKVGDDIKERHVQGLVRLFEQYNFTIEENSPREVEVSLDPELLGRVFENLLAAYNPETGESVRKSTGSFYTPREIVNYMVNESLVAYLKDKTTVTEKDLRLLLSYDDDVPSLSNDQKEQVENAIKNCKVLDPACGSGAFPMGMLQQMVHLWERVFPATSTGYTSRQAAMYERKLFLIEHCIFGVDIQPIAMLISKLRFFISLICEQPKADFDLKKRKENYGINTLPALETKFVAANTLIPAAVRSFDNEWTQDETLVKLKDDLLAIRHDNFVSQSYSKKRRLMKKSMEKCQEIHDYIMENSYKPNQQRIEMLEAQIAKLEAEKLEYAGERWVEEAVIGDLFGAGTEEPKKHDANLTKRKEIDKAIENCRQDIKKEQQKSAPQGFEKAVTELTAWDPYDQNTSSPFFDAEWMFGIEINRPDECNGFDIVIGNPPYIQLQENEGYLANLYYPYGFSSFDRRGDIYELFYEKGNKLLCVNGSLCFITSNGWMKSGYGDNLRAYLALNSNPLLLIDFNQMLLFENAIVETNILLIRKQQNEFRCKACSFLNYERNVVLGNINQLVQQESSTCKFTSIGSWAVLEHSEQYVKSKIEETGVIIKNWNLTIYRGITTGCNEGFIIDEDARQSIYAKADDEEKTILDDTIYPILQGRNLKKYSYTFTGKYMIVTPRGYNINLTPTLKRYMMTHYDALSSKSGSSKWYELQASPSETMLQNMHKEKILWGEISDSAKFTFDEGRFFAEATTFMMTTNDKSISLKYLLAILNSSLSVWYFRKIATTTGMGTNRWKKYKLELLPVVKATSTQQKEIISLVDTILSKKKANPQNDTSAEEKKIDKLVYELYGLEPEEIRIVEEQ